MTADQTFACVMLVMYVALTLINIGSMIDARRYNRSAREHSDRGDVLLKKCVECLKEADRLAGGKRSARDRLDMIRLESLVRGIDRNNPRLDRHDPSKFLVPPKGEA